VVSMTDENVARLVIDYAHSHNITKFIAGKPMRPRWFEVIRGTVIDQILRQSGKIDVYVITEDIPLPQRAITAGLTPHSPASRYVLSLAMVLLITGLGFPLSRLIDQTNLVMLYLLVVLIASVYLGRGPSILASIVSVLAFDFFFVNPHYSFSVSDTQYLLTFLVLLVVGLVISNSAALLRDQVEVLRRRERQTPALNRFGGELTSAITLSQVLEVVIRNVGELFGRETAILLPVDPARPGAPSTWLSRHDPGASSTSHLRIAGTSEGLNLEDSELAVAEWAFKNNRSAGRGTDTLPAAEIRFVPLVSAHGPVGVLGIRALNPTSSLSNEQHTLMEGVTNLAALAIERASLAEEANQAEMLRQTEKLQTALLNSISHELRTPLASITGVLTSLGESALEAPENQLDPATSLDLIDSATRQASRLNRLVENLLDMTRLEAGALRLNPEPGDFQDLVNGVLGNSRDRFCDHPIQISLQDGLPMVTMDTVLISQVLDNLLDNACKYSPPGSPIGIQATAQKDCVTISMVDRGIGIPSGDLERIFDKFYRAQQPQPAVTGTGLGLSICKGIVEAHGGRIWAENNPDGGATLSFTLPLPV